MTTTESRGRAVVTGASVGIGAATAHALHTAGYTVLAASRRLSTEAPAATGITHLQPLTQ